MLNKRIFIHASLGAAACMAALLGAPAAAQQPLHPQPCVSCATAFQCSAALLS